MKKKIQQKNIHIYKDGASDVQVGDINKYTKYDIQCH